MYLEKRAHMTQSLCRRFALIAAISFVLAGCSESFAATDAEDEQQAQQAQLAPEQRDPALRLARASRAAGDLASSINLYRGVTAMKPADPAIMIELGDTLLQAGGVDDAIDAYNQVPETSNARLGALLGLERAYFALGEFGKELEYADKAVALAPNDEKALIGCGVALDSLDRHEEAQTYYRTVIAATPHNLAARNDLALSLALSGKFEEAIEIMTSIARSTTSTPRTRQNLALIYGLMGERERAKELSLVDLSPSDTEANLQFFDLVRSASK